MSAHWLTVSLWPTRGPMSPSAARPVHDGGVEGYDDATYGEAFADVYDDWYAELGDLGATVAMLASYAGGGRVLELGVGTGRLAIALAPSVGEVVGVDASPRMLSALAAKPGGAAVRALQGDMVDDLPDGPFDLVVVAYNTLFNLRSEARQQSCMRAVAERLAPGGRFVVEAFVPADDDGRTSGVGLRSMSADRVVLSVSRSDSATQIAEGQYVEFTERGGVRLRPWSIRWATPTQLDEMAAAAGLVLERRWGSFAGDEFVVDSERHVSVYRPADSSSRSRIDGG